MSKNVLSIDWCNDDDEEIIIPTKVVIFDPRKTKISVSHYLTIEDLRVKCDVELDMNRKKLYEMGMYQLEEGELLE